MGQLDPAIVIVTTNLPIVVVVLFCFWKRWFRLGKDVIIEKELMEKGHAKEVELLILSRDEYRTRWEEEKRDRLALTDRITPLTETIRQSAGLIERSVQISEGLLNEQAREAGHSDRSPRRYVPRSRTGAKPASRD